MSVWQYDALSEIYWALYGGLNFIYLNICAIYIYPVAHTGTNINKINIQVKSQLNKIFYL